MSSINKRLVSQYDLQLRRMQDVFKEHDREWFDVLQRWREDLHKISDQDALKAHASRTARTMGGMESLGEVVMMGNDPEALHLLEELYAVCKFITSS